MNILIPFIPMILHSALYSYSIPLAISLSLFFATKTILKSFYIMDWMTFLFILLDGICFLFTQSRSIHFLLSPFSTFAYTLFFFASLLGKEPFTAHYAKKQVPEQLWTSAVFLKVNQILTFLFAIIFLIEALLKTTRFFYPELLPYPFFFITCNALIPIMVYWIPRWYKRKKQKEVLT